MQRVKSAKYSQLVTVTAGFSKLVAQAALALKEADHTAKDQPAMDVFVLWLKGHAQCSSNGLLVKCL
jgi:hypothetical protein